MNAYRKVRTPILELAYEASGPETGTPVVLLHGWPSDPRDYDAVAPTLAESGCRVLVPFLRGFGPTRFLDPNSPRSGQQAALGVDLRDFLDALSIDRALLCGYDRGGRAACIVAALWPERVNALVSMTGYNLQNIANSGRPAPAEFEYRLWYQWYFNTERGRTGLERNRRDLCRMLWRLWSPHWHFDDPTFEATAASFDNPDFVAVTIHSYRHRYGNASSDPAFDELEERLATQPPIAAPTIVLHGAEDGVAPPITSEGAARHFTGPFERHVIPLAGHFIPREAPEAVIRAVRDLL
jgi:pimeloyl-ACP methyl ester carboxylesterase